MQLINYDSGKLKCSVSGEIDHHSAKRIREEVDRRIKEYTPTEVVMDLSGVTFMDSSGLGLVLGRYTFCKSADIEFSVTGADRRIMKIFELAGLGRIINIEDCEK